MGWEHFRHGADVGIRGIGATKAEAFEQAALALTAIITCPDNVRPVDAVTVRCSAADDEILLVDWINALVFEMATRNMLFGGFKVALQDATLQATAWGETVDIQRHAPAVEAKGATFTELAVRQLGEGCWIAQCVVDV
jgi:tRNA nucleotidyltransferase (CCA-adding enzyme)